MAQFLDLTGLTRYKNKSDALYAKQDGSYEGMTVGNAEQLVSTVGVEDNAPYTFRTTGGSADVGDRLNLKAVVGGTVAWNQHNTFDPEWVDGQEVEKNGVTFVYSAAKHSITVKSGGHNTSTTFNVLIGTDFAIPNGRKVLVLGLPSGLDNVNGVFFSLYNGNSANAFNRNSIISISKGSGQYLQPYIYVRSGYTVPNDMEFKPIIVDLTAMFGSTIADYVYTLESGTAGAGIAWLKKYGYFTKPYYPYKAAAFESVKTSAHKTYGFNAYNPSTGKAKVVGGNLYQITGAYTALSLDGTSITPDANGYFTPSANGELTVTGGNGTTTCIHLKWDGERDGEWEEFSEHTYALDDVELRGVPKKDANNNLYYDGDKYTPDGTVQRRYGIVDLGTLNWIRNVGTQYYTDFTGGKADTTNGLTSNGKYLLGTGGYSGIDHRITIKTSRIWLTDSDYTTPSALTAALSGVYLVYELETPTTESADAYTELQVCDDFGTEEFVDAATRDFEMPCGSFAVYRPNLRAKLEMSPNSPDGDGDYLVRQTNGVNEYVLFSEVKELPDYPTTDGTYVLKCTVADGTATLSWVSE